MGDSPAWLEGLQARVEQFRPEALRVLSGLGNSPPATIYHYTDARGLMGILESGCLRASHGLYVNDRAELSYVDEVVAEASESLKPRVRNTIAESVFSAIARPHWHDVDGFEQVYLACFSQHRDQLSQWRAYAGDGAGYSVGLATGQFRVRSVPEAEVLLIKVLYERADQIQLVSPFLEQILDELNNCPDNTPKKHSEAAHFTGVVAVWDVVAALGAAMKNPGFDEEAEWRLVVTDPKSTPMGTYVDFRPGPFGVTPYISLEPSDEKLPIREVILGPRLHQRQAKQAAMGLLAKHRIQTAHAGAPDFVPVVHSRTTYRGGDT